MAKHRQREGEAQERQETTKKMKFHQRILLLSLVPSMLAQHLLPWQPDDSFRTMSAIAKWFVANASFVRNRRWESATRWDQTSLVPSRYTTVNVSVLPGRSKRSPPVPLNDKESFIIRLECDPQVSKELCDKVKLGFVSSAHRLTSSLNIYSPIVIDAKFYSFTKVQESLSQTLGMAGATSLWSVGLNETLISQRYNIRAIKDSRWLIPQALMKQLVTKEMDATVQWSASDITAYFNSDYAFWFEGDGAITSQSIAFELVATHEMVHFRFKFKGEKGAINPDRHTDWDSIRPFIHTFQTHIHRR